MKQSYSVMNTSHIFGVSCAAVCVLFSGAMAEQEALSASGESVVVALQDGQVTEKGVLDESLLFVVDKKTADAAAPVVEMVLREHADIPKEMMLSEYDRSLLAATSCFGSAQLLKSLRPVFVPDSQYQAQLAPYLALQAELGLVLDDMAKLLKHVHDKASADAAAEMAENIPAYMASLSEKVAALPNHDDDQLQRARVRRYQVTVRPGASRLLRAWGKLMAESADMYGSTRLLAALPQVNEVLENLGMAADPAVLPQLVQATEVMQPLLEEWLQVSQCIKDRSSADAAAPRLLELAEAVRATSISKLGNGYEKDLSNVSPRLQVLMMATDRISHWFEDLPTPFYGSEALKKALEHEE